MLVTAVVLTDQIAGDAKRPANEWLGGIVAVSRLEHGNRDILQEVVTGGEVSNQGHEITRDHRLSQCPLSHHEFSPGVHSGPCRRDVSFEIVDPEAQIVTGKILMG